MSTPSWLKGNNRLQSSLSRSSKGRQSNSSERYNSHSVSSSTRAKVSKFLSKDNASAKKAGSRYSSSHPNDTLKGDGYDDDDFLGDLEAELNTGGGSQQRAKPVKETRARGKAKPKVGLQKMPSIDIDEFSDDVDVDYGHNDVEIDIVGERGGVEAEDEEEEIELEVEPDDYTYNQNEYNHRIGQAASEDIEIEDGVEIGEDDMYASEEAELEIEDEVDVAEDAAYGGAGESVEIEMEDDNDGLDEIGELVEGEDEELDIELEDGLGDGQEQELTLEEEEQVRGEHLNTAKADLIQNSYGSGDESYSMSYLDDADTKADVDSGNEKEGKSIALLQKRYSLATSATADSYLDDQFESLPDTALESKAANDNVCIDETPRASEQKFKEKQQNTAFTQKPKRKKRELSVAFEGVEEALKRLTERRPSVPSVISEEPVDVCADTNASNLKQQEAQTQVQVQAQACEEKIATEDSSGVRRRSSRVEAWGEASPAPPAAMNVNVQGQGFGAYFREEDRSKYAERIEFLEARLKQQETTHRLEMELMEKKYSHQMEALERKIKNLEKRLESRLRAPPGHAYDHDAQTSDRQQRYTYNHPSYMAPHGSSPYFYPPPPVYHPYSMVMHAPPPPARVGTRGAEVFGDQMLSILRSIESCKSVLQAQVYEDNASISLLANSDAFKGSNLGTHFELLKPNVVEGTQQGTLGPVPLTMDQALKIVDAKML